MIPIKKISFKKLLKTCRDGEVYDWYCAQPNDKAPIGKIMVGRNGLTINMYIGEDMNPKEFSKYVQDIGYIPISMYNDDYFIRRC